MHMKGIRRTNRAFLRDSLSENFQTRLSDTNASDFEFQKHMPQQTTIRLV